METRRVHAVTSDARGGGRASGATGWVGGGAEILHGNHNKHTHTHNINTTAVCVRAITQNSRASFLFWGF